MSPSLPGNSFLPIVVTVARAAYASARPKYRSPASWPDNRRHRFPHSLESLALFSRAELSREGMSFAPWVTGGERNRRAHPRALLPEILDQSPLMSSEIALPCFAS
ncbi:hypothetical protein PUN28_000622 [Cardiocondyla obscurior]|uniref:Uncharacterized protein n=1 Tax=Cardiocondyla obscurior TaxID=286306 RepID=A0AAW2H0D5_9HYME